MSGTGGNLEGDAIYDSESCLCMASCNRSLEGQESASEEEGGFSTWQRALARSLHEGRTSVAERDHFIGYLCVSVVSDSML
jgi:hypothetical protein